MIRAMRVLLQMELTPDIGLFCQALVSNFGLPLRLNKGVLTSVPKHEFSLNFAY